MLVLPPPPILSALIFLLMETLFSTGTLLFPVFFFVCDPLSLPEHAGRVLTGTQADFCGYTPEERRHSLQQLFPVRLWGGITVRSLSGALLHLT